MAGFDAEIQMQLAQFAADLASPVGRIAFERVARRHLELLDRLRQLGLTWAQVGMALHRHGITRDDGSPLSGAQLSSVASRQRQPEPVTVVHSALGRQTVNDNPSIRREKRAAILRPPATMSSLESSRNDALTQADDRSPGDVDKNAIRARMREQKALRDRLG